MYQTIHETINVFGTFTSHHFIPQKFEWKHQIYPVKEITSVHDLRDGGVKKRRYAVLSKGNLYLIEYNRDQEFWLLEQVWFEG